VTNLSYLALVVASSFAVNNWLAVLQRKKPLEYVTKPGAMVALIVVAMSLDAPSSAQRWAIVAGLALSLAGDVFLMLPTDRFIAGVAAFFAAHLAYIVAFRLMDTSPGALLIGAAFVAIFALVVGRRILIGVRDTAPELVTPVSAYIAVISVMVASAIATKNPYAIAGALLFMGSDTLIAWNRFVQPLRWAPVTIMVTYHAAQLLIVLTLVHA
jgi:uncharacterized membrane protein YhhN